MGVNKNRKSIFTHKGSNKIAVTCYMLILNPHYLQHYNTTLHVRHTYSKKPSMLHKSDINILFGHRLSTDSYFSR